MTTCAEILRLAQEKPPVEARDLLLAYEEWWRRRGDRQAARYWAGASRELAQIAVENYQWAETVRAAAAAIELPAGPFRDFYVSIVRSPTRRGLLLGPFTTHAAALDRVDAVRSAAVEIDPVAGFDGFGTASVPRGSGKPGRLNSRLPHLLEEGPPP